MERESKNSKEAFDIYQKVVNILVDINDKRGLKLVEELIDKCVNYVVTVANVEKIMGLQRFRKDTDEAEIEEFKDWIS